MLFFIVRDDSSPMVGNISGIFINGLMFCLCSPAGGIFVPYVGFTKRRAFNYYLIRMIFPVSHFRSPLLFCGIINVIVRLSLSKEKKGTESDKENKL